MPDYQNGFFEGKEYLFFSKEKIDILLRAIDADRTKNPSTNSNYGLIFKPDTSDLGFSELRARNGWEIDAVDLEIAKGDNHFGMFPGKAAVFPGNLHPSPYKGSFVLATIEFHFVFFREKEMRELVNWKNKEDNTGIAGINFMYCETTVNIENERFAIPFANIIAEPTFKENTVGDTSTPLVFGYPCPPKWPPVIKKN